MSEEERQHLFKEVLTNSYQQVYTDQTITTNEMINQLSEKLKNLLYQNEDMIERT